jgi:hypothetical protein
MPVNSFSVGRDATLTIVTASGPLNLNLVTGFHSSPDMAQIKVKGLDGITRHARFFDGWKGGFDIERSDSVVDDYFAQLEANYYAGINEQPATITETITETSGAVSQYRYLNVLLMLDDAGSWAGDQTVKQKLSFVAARRVKIA